MRRNVLHLILILWLALALPTVTSQENQARLPGRIAYVGEDYNIYVFNFDADGPIQLTTDAAQTKRYQWPTWSTDGRLAYFSSSIENGRLLTSAYISPDGLTAGESVFSGPDVFNYAYWAPRNCAVSEGCRDLAVLLSGMSRGMFVEIIRDQVTQAGSLTAGLGGPPFYYSWSPDGTRMLWQRNNRRFDIYDASQDRVVQTLPQLPGTTMAPAWSPVDDRLLIGASGSDGTTDLVIQSLTNQSDSPEEQVLADGFTGLISYNWSPDGNLIAYRELTRDGFGSLTVVDALSREVIAQSSTSGVIAFFWSPNSRQIAYLTLGIIPGSFSAQSSQMTAQSQRQPVGIAWSLLDVFSGRVQQYGAFIPTEEMLYLVQYFDQFAQSHRIWSPDSRYLLYSEVIPSGPVISLLDTTQLGSVPESIADGVIGIWSFD